MIRYSVQIAPYFYNSYLAAKIYERNGKQKEAEEQAQSALQSYDESDYFYIMLYVMNYISYWAVTLLPEESRGISCFARR